MKKDMFDHLQKLRQFCPDKEFLIGIDSDGCAFDAMEIKHKECFIPNIINSWDLQPYARYAREVAEFVNLYSIYRGCNRFIGIELVLDLLGKWDKPVELGYKTPDITPLREWIKHETRLGNPALEEAVKKNNDPILKKTLDWSIAVNETVSKIVRNVPPFKYVRESLKKISQRADIIVVSATPYEALAREWQEHGLTEYIRMICGQEMGNKKEHLQHGACGKYEKNKILMIGDALGDMRAAKDNGVCFYPINPGSEAHSWQRFYEEACERFFSGTYKGPYEDDVINEFKALLPSIPPWAETSIK